MAAASGQKKDEVARTRVSELALPDAGIITVIPAWVRAATVLCVSIGWERERKGRAAGLKTHVPVSVG